MKAHLVLGGPGCGKTTRLLDIMEEELANGVSPNKIAFVSFTKAATEEARERATERFGYEGDRDLPWFRTIHSLAFRRLRLNRDEVMGKPDWKEFGRIVGYDMINTQKSNDEDGIVEITSGKDIGYQMLRVVDYGRNCLISLLEAHEKLRSPFGWYELERFSNTLTAYKDDVGKIDYTDMLVNFPGTDPIDVDVAIIDEAQDLTPAQWRVVEIAFHNADRIYYAGDDDQSIYTWAGADVPKFLNLAADREVLPVSHRLSRQVHEYVQGLASRISVRYEKPYKPNGRDGVVAYWQTPEQLPLDTFDGSILLLARNRYLLEGWEELVRSMGLPYDGPWGVSIKPNELKAIVGWERWRKGKTIPGAMVEQIFRHRNELPTKRFNRAKEYTPEEAGVQTNNSSLPIWHKWLTGIHYKQREYYIACLRRGESLTKPPRIRIKTIHGVKGQEADHVAMMSDISPSTERGYQEDPDNEHRVFFVGASRAKHSLNLIQPQTATFYTL